MDEANIPLGAKLVLTMKNIEGRMSVCQFSQNEMMVRSNSHSFVSNWEKK